MGGDAGMRLLGSPRVVPWGVRIQLLTDRTVVNGALVFGISSAIAVLAILASNPIGAWRLARRPSTASGQLVAVEDMHYNENGVNLLRCQYAFRTPDGVERRGVCYLRGRSLAAPPPAAEHDPKLRPRVPIKYSSQHPEISCINMQGMRPGAVDPMFGQILAIGAVVGIVILLRGFLAGGRKLRLMAVGEPARATVVSCRFLSQVSSDTPGGKLTIAQVRQFWLSRVGPGGVPVGDPSPINQIPAPTRAPQEWLLKFWTGSAIVIFGFGTVILITALSLEPLKGLGLIPFNVQPVAPGLRRLFWGFLAIWLIMGWLFIWMGVRRSAMLSGKKSFAQLYRTPALLCTFHFTLPGGQTIRARDTATSIARLGDAPTEPMLYDPARPGEAILVNGLAPTVEISEFGDWLNTDGLQPWRRAALVVALISGGPTVGWMARQAL